MKGNRIPHPAVVLAIGTLALGWMAGYWMNRPGTQKPTGQESGTGSFVQSGSGIAPNTGSNQEAPRDAAADVTTFQPVGGNGDLGAQIDTLMRGALRITDNTDRIVRLREIARWIDPKRLPDAVEKAKRLSYSERWQVLQA